MRALNRFREIDLFRAIAILMVIGFHYFSRWVPPVYDTNLYPYGDAFAGNVILNHGHLGVEFFFIISGYVIALTLESCRTPAEFFARRLARLLPAMIVCSLLTLAIVRLFVTVPLMREEATLWNLLPSWTFTEPHLWSKALPVTDHVDGAYWSLVVEAKFYVWAALLYFLQRQHFVRNLVVICAVMTILYTIDDVHSVRWIKRLSIVTFGQYAMLFAAGVAFYQLHSRPGDAAKWWPYLAAAMGLELTRISITADTEGTRLATAAFEITFFLAFLAVAWGWQAPKNKVVDILARIGLVSYPMYLLHQNIGVGLLNRTMGESPLVIVAVFAAICAALVAASLFLHTAVEQPGKRLILSLLLPPKFPRLRPGV